MLSVPGPAPRDVAVDQRRSSSQEAQSHDGDVEQATADALMAGVRSTGLTELLMCDQQHFTERRGQVGYAGVVWPCERWSDEPIPDFAHAAVRRPARLRLAAASESRPVRRRLTTTHWPSE